MLNFLEKNSFFGPLFSLGILKKSKSVFLGMKLDVCKLNSNLSEVKNLSVRIPNSFHYSLSRQKVGELNSVP